MVLALLENLQREPMPVVVVVRREHHWGCLGLSISCSACRKVDGRYAPVALRLGRYPSRSPAAAVDHLRILEK